MREIRTSGSVGGPPSTIVSTVAYPDNRVPIMSEAMMTKWTYYKQGHPNGVWSLFRADEQASHEIFHRREGWQSSDELLRRMAAGEVDHDDIVTEAEAEALIRSISGAA